MKKLKLSIEWSALAVLFLGATTAGIFFAKTDQPSKPGAPAVASAPAATPHAAPSATPVSMHDSMHTPGDSGPFAADIPLPSGSQDIANPQAELTMERFDRDRVPLVMIEGGIAGSRRCLERHGVQEFVKDSGAAAGLNGTFFANASLHGTDNLLIGPSLCGDEHQVTLSPYDRKPALSGRPLVLLSADRTRIVPYDPKTMDSDIALRSLLPRMTDTFLGGVWLVHNGIAATDEDIERSAVHDANDFRRRAFFGLTTDGRPVLGATTYVTSSKKLAQALQDADLLEAVLLDSGFSTSLVYGDKILVTGHTAPGIPSRPVPHAIVLFGQTSVVKEKTQPPAAPSGKSV
jgi:biofilm PGA synthesis lipoprotein PgaB